VEVHRFFCDNALMWLRGYYLDGLRLDAVHALAAEHYIGGRADGSSARPL
jgi:maltooligosyltrehalose trehalohydrolase